MDDLPDQWRKYARLQEKLAKKQQVDDFAWGLEAGLNRLLESNVPPVEEVDRTVKSASRKERYQEQLRRAHLADQESAKNSADIVDARRRLHLIKHSVTSQEYALLLAVGEGYEYKELGANQNMDTGALRVRMMRLRHSLGSLGGTFGPFLTGENPRHDTIDFAIDH
ncbi:MAG: hypothetical protein ACRD19_07405 [Terriglobia bacterium]